jgi:hypothetical protein
MSITQYVLEKYINPARKRGDYVVGLRSGDVSKALKEQNPTVCVSLGSDKFLKNTGVISRIALLGPSEGANTLFVYLIREVK